jgi:hypothetical protein
MKSFRSLLGKYAVVCLALTLTYAFFVAYINPRMKRYEQQNLLISQRIKDTDLCNAANREALISIWQADTNMNKILIGVVRYQFATTLCVLTINCVVLFFLYRRITRLSVVEHGPESAKWGQTLKCNI